MLYSSVYTIYGTQFVKRFCLRYFILNGDSTIYIYVYLYRNGNISETGDKLILNQTRIYRDIQMLGSKNR